MSVRSKIFLSLGIVVLLFAAGLFWIQWLDSREFQRVTGAQQAGRAEAFDQFLEQNGQPLASFVRDQGASDGIAQATATGDRAWMEKNVPDSLLAEQGVQVLWVYDKERKLVHSRNQLYADGLHEVPLPRSGFDEALGDDRVAHFFANTPAGLIEVRGATIHAAGATGQSDTPVGYLFAGRIWSLEGLAEMSARSESVLALVDPKYALPRVDPGSGEMVFSKLLPGWDGAPVMRLTAQHRSPVLAHVAQVKMRQLIWLAMFLATILLVFLYALRRWVWRPLGLLAASMRTDSLEVLRPLENERGEVGELSRLITAFFLQRASLLEESRAVRLVEKAAEADSEKVRGEEKMEAIGRLAGGVAQDFSNLLTVIVGYAALLRNKLSNLSLPVQETEVILTAGKRAGLLTRQLLAFSQKQVLHPQVVDLNRLVAETELQIARIVGEQVEVRIRADARQGQVRADPAQLEQVLLNLAANAGDAMPKGGVLTITTGDTVVSEPLKMEQGAVLQSGRYITLEMADTGGGMDPATAAQMFEPFFTTKPPGEGTGLGLATVYGIVAQSGGRISASTTEGEGTTFLIHFPLETAAVEEPEPVVEVTSQESRGETILVLADDGSMRDLISAVLEDRGYKVMAPANEAAALALAAEHSGDLYLAVCDTGMAADARERILQAVRNGRPALKVLYVSGYIDPAINPDTARISPNLVVDKPFTSDELATRVRRLLDSNQGPIVDQQHAGSSSLS